MRWTTEYVWGKIESIIPSARSFDYQIPEALKACAVKLFLSYESGDTPDAWRAYVIAECLKELQTVGYLVAGTVEEDWI